MSTSHSFVCRMRPFPRKRPQGLSSHETSRERQNTAEIHLCWSRWRSLNNNGLTAGSDLEVAVTWRMLSVIRVALDMWRVQNTQDSLQRNHWLGAILHWNGVQQGTALAGMGISAVATKLKEEQAAIIAAATKIVEETKAVTAKLEKEEAASSAAATKIGEEMKAVTAKLEEEAASSAAATKHAEEISAVTSKHAEEMNALTAKLKEEQVANSAAATKHTEEISAVAVQLEQEQASDALSSLRRWRTVCASDGLTYVALAAAKRYFARHSGSRFIRPGLRKWVASYRCFQLQQIADVAGMSAT